MRKIMMIVAAAVCITAAPLVASTGAEARFGADVIANAVAAPKVEQVQYYYGYRRPYYAPALLRTALLRAALLRTASLLRTALLRAAPLLLLSLTRGCSGWAAACQPIRTTPSPIKIYLQRAGASGVNACVARRMCAQSGG